jgi:hypothetical protein
MAVGFVALALSLERLVNAMMVGGLSYGSPRVIVAVTCAVAGVSMILLGALSRRKDE